MSSRQLHRQRVAYRERIRSGEVILCALCGDPIPLKSKTTNKGSISLDHIIRKRDGGSDDESNIQPTHSKCNWKRG